VQLIFGSLDAQAIRRPSVMKMNAIRFAAVVTILLASLIAAAQAMPAATHLYMYNKGWNFLGTVGYYVS
jgi:hypothetical protein